MNDDGCPFCKIAAERIAFSGELFDAIWDGFPVAEGHLLLLPKRHIPKWLDLSKEERIALADAIGSAQQLLGKRYSPDGFNVGFNESAAGGQTVPHFHIHVIPRRTGDVPDPRGGVRHVIPSKANYLSAAENSRIGIGDPPHKRALITGGDDALIRHLLPHIDQSHSADIVVSFVLESGVRLLQPRLQELLSRGGRLRIVTGDYLDVTDPLALRRLLDLEGNVQRWVFEAHPISFHPKSWIFHLPGQGGLSTKRGQRHDRTHGRQCLCARPNRSFRPNRKSFASYLARKNTSGNTFISAMPSIATSNRMPVRVNLGRNARRLLMSGIRPKADTAGLALMGFDPN